MSTNSNIPYRIFLYPILGLLLAACGGASTPATNQVSTTSLAELAVTSSATTVPSTTPTVMPTTTSAPTSTNAPTQTTAPAATIVPTGTSVPTGTIAPSPPSATVPVQQTVVPVPPASVSVPTTQSVPHSTAAKVLATIKLFQFKPNVLVIKTGTTVVWTNQDAIEHSVTSGTPPASSGAFDSGFFTQGQSFTFTFTKPGTYTYFCMRHNSMTGSVKVIAP